MSNARRSASLAVFALFATAFAACAGGSPPAQPGITIGDAGSSVTVAPSAAQTSALVALKEKLAPAKAMTATSLAAARAVPFAAALGYDPMAAKNLPLIQASHVPLAADELALLAKNGFVISDKKHYPGFVYGYESIYADDLPVFVSADSIMHTVHRSYDAILKTVESERLVPELGALLDSMRARLASPTTTDGFSAQTIKDADFFLAVAKALLDKTGPALVAGGDAAAANRWVTDANAAAGAADVQLFGLSSHYDFSQFKPRGHYVGAPALEQYFRAMMWLGRTELPIIHVDENTGEARFVRRQLDLAVALRRLMDDAAFTRWKLIDATIRAFVGEPDSMSPPQIDTLMADLGATDVAALAALSDQTIAQKIVDGGYGKQAISSQVIINGVDGTLPLSSVWLFLGQRYVVDSHVFSNVVYDRVLTEPKRMMPNPLDVAYAALKNDQAVSLLADDLAKHSYAPDLETMRVLADQYDGTFWHANLYNEWLGALRALSPTAEIASATSGLPAVARSAAWGRRVMNTQLASWAELRRDTILYAKQSYSSGVTCEFPDAYVDPYPAFYAALESYAEKGSALADTLVAGSTSTLAASVKTYFLHLGDVSRILREMAEHQRTGTPHTAAHLAFINEAVKIQRGCGGATAEGWYPKLFFIGVAAAEFDPTIADVHTAPQDGTKTGAVLHVATGYPRLMVVTIDTCDGPRAYAGVVSAYHEKVTTNYQRLNDQDWAQELSKAPAADVPWMSDLIAR